MALPTSIPPVTGVHGDVYARFAGAPVAIVPACGSTIIPGDLAAAIAARDLAARASASACTTKRTRRCLRAARTSALGVLGRRRFAAQSRRLSLPRQPRRDRMAGGERVTVPRHLPAPK